MEKEPRNSGGSCCLPAGPSQTPLGPPSPAESQHGSTHPCSRPKLPLGPHRWHHSYREADSRPHWPRLSRPRVHSVPRMRLPESTGALGTELGTGQPLGIRLLGAAQGALGGSAWVRGQRPTCVHAPTCNLHTPTCRPPRTHMYPHAHTHPHICTRTAPWLLGHTADDIGIPAQ